MTSAGGQVYDSIEVLLDCEVIAVLPGNASSWRREFASDGVYHISLRANWGAESRSTEACKLAVGPGQVVRSFAFDSSSGYGGDLTADGGMLLVAPGRERRVHMLSLDLEPLRSFYIDEELVAPGNEVSGLARGGEPGTLFVYNRTQSRLGRIDFSGNLTEELQISGAGPGGVVRGMSLRDAAGGGSGTLLIEYWTHKPYSAYIYEVNLSGQVFRTLQHPYFTLDPPVGRCGIGSHVRGISSVSQGRGDEVYLMGWMWRRGGDPLIFRSTLGVGGIVKGSEVPIPDELYVYNAHEFVSKQGEPRLFILGGGTDGQARVYEVQLEPSSIPGPTRLRGHKTGLENDVQLDFANNGPYDSIEIFRDCRPIATLDGAATMFVEHDVPPGYRDYSVRGIVKGEASAMARCTLRVGPGALLQIEGSCTEALWEGCRDPLDGSFYVTSHTYNHPRRIDHYDADLNYLDTRDLAIGNEWILRTLAVRVTPRGERLLVYIAQLAGSFSHRLVSETLDGEIVSEETVGTAGQPHGLTWDPTSDTFYFHEPIFDIVAQIDPSGRTIRRFTHPDPPVNHIVEDLGLTISPDRQSLFFLSSHPSDTAVSRVVEMGIDGQLTGYEIAVPREELQFRITGIALAGSELIAVGLSTIARLEAFDAPPPDDAASFLRGDSNGDHSVDLSDAVHHLNYLFQMGPTPRCIDAADTNDDGSLDLSDPIYVLLFLFRAGEVPPAPFPLEGTDPSPDSLTCGGL